MGWLKEYYGPILILLAFLGLQWKMLDGVEARLAVRLERVEVRLEHVEQDVAWIKGHIAKKQANLR